MLETLSEVEQVLPSAVLLEQRGRLWLHFDTVKRPRFGAPVVDILAVVLLEVEEVHGVDPDQVEDQPRYVHGPLLGHSLARVIKEDAQLGEGDRPFASALLFDLETPKGVQLQPDHLLIDGLIEDRPNVSQMDRAGVRGQTGT